LEEHGARSCTPMPANFSPVFGEKYLRSPTIGQEVNSVISGSSEISWALSGPPKNELCPLPADPYVHPEAVEGLLEEDVLATSGFSIEVRASVGAGERAR
jgi:hypothetical protein